MSDANAHNSGFDPIEREEMIKALKECTAGFCELSAIFSAIKENGEADYVDLAGAGRRIAEEMAANSDVFRDQAEKVSVRQ